MDVPLGKAMSHCGIQSTEAFKLQSMLAGPRDQPLQQPAPARVLDHLECCVGDPAVRPFQRILRGKLFGHAQVLEPAR